MKRIIITLAMVALASTAWAQATPEVTLPQYQPPSYSSPHGGTGMDFTHHIKPHTPNITAPQSGGYGGYAHEYVVPFDRPYLSQAKEKEALNKYLTVCAKSNPDYSATPECLEAAAELNKSKLEHAEESLKALDDFNRRKNQLHNDNLKRLGTQR